MYSQADVAKKLSKAHTAIDKNGLQAAMYALNDALGMICKIQPELGRLIAYKEGDDLRSGLPSGTLKKASINQEITEATLCIGRGDYSRAAEKVVRAIRMLVWVAKTKDKVLAVTHSPAEQNA
jgi:hypothetical protein